MLNASEITGLAGGTTSLAGATVRPYRDPGRITLLLQVLLLISAVVSAILVAQAIAELRLVARLRDTGTVALDEVNAIDELRAVVIVVQLAVLMVAGLTFVVWTHQHYRNLPALGATARRLSEREAIGGWFVPVLNLIWPKQVLDDIWRASATPGQAVCLRPGRPVPMFLHVWWAVWTAAVLLRVASTREVDDLEGARNVLVLDIVGSFALVSAALLAVLAVGMLADRQRRHGRGDGSR